MNDFIRNVISVDEITSRLNGTIIMAKLMEYKVSYGKGVYGPVIVLKKDNRDFFKLKIINRGSKNKNGIHFIITIRALQDRDIYNKYQTIKLNYKPYREDPTCVVRKGNNTVDSCIEVIEDLSLLL